MAYMECLGIIYRRFIDQDLVDLLHELLQHKHQVLMAQGPPTKAPVQLGEQEFGRI